MAKCLDPNLDHIQGNTSHKNYPEDLIVILTNSCVTGIIC